MTSAVASPKPAVLTADSVTSSLREMILKGRLSIGVQLKQEALAKQFGVSRIPVREALKRLEAEGLIEHTANAGSVVASKSTQDLLETLDIRIALETRALKVAVPRMTKADIKAAKEIITRYDGSDSPLEWTELNLEFHLCLYRACGRPRLLKMIEDIVRSINIHLRAHQSSTVGRKSPQTEHKSILKACAAGDVDLAVSLLEQHIEHTQRALLDAESRP
ncbi:GntR family transcriptional regulator [Variovorax sp. CF313]|uniref:GntR family transcriptional regulator n=1 Tax=Variovorax sp. CF313 TaxID=1144315 RepID=UPI0005B283E2|nr:GntR family transcriptional regulator [Variovorax sp. CF313]